MIFGTFMEYAMMKYSYYYFQMNQNCMKYILFAASVALVVQASTTISSSTKSSSVTKTQSTTPTSSSTNVGLVSASTQRQDGSFSASHQTQQNQSTTLHPSESPNQTGPQYGKNGSTVPHQRHYAIICILFIQLIVILT